MKWRPLEPDNTVTAWHVKKGGTKLEAEGRLEGLTMCQGSTLKTCWLSSEVPQPSPVAPLWLVCQMLAWSQFIQQSNIIQPGARHVKSSVAIVVSNPDISSMLDQDSNSSKVCIGSCSMQRSSTKSGRCIGAFTTLQTGEKLILKVFSLTNHLNMH